MAASPTMSGSSSTGSIPRCSRPRTEAVRQARGRARHPGAGRLWRARHRRQDRGGALCPRAAGALFRHLLRHADGGDRGGAPPRRPAGRRLDRVRPVPASGDRADDRMDARQRRRAAQFDRRSRRHDAARRLRGGARPAEAGSPRSTAPTQISERHRHRYEVNIAYQERLEAPGCGFPACRPTGSCPRSSRSPITPGSSACSSIPS